MPVIRPKYQVFISSTYTDLREFRERVTWAVLEARHIPVGMEIFSATNERGWETIQRAIDQSDYYILLLAGRYGSFDESVGMSWTHREYRYAKEQGIPVMALRRTDTTIAVADAESHNDQRARLAAFIAEVQSSHMWKQWGNGDELVSQVKDALRNHIQDDEDNQRSRPGWYRGSQLPVQGLSGWDMQASAAIGDKIQRALQNAGTSLHHGRMLRVVSSFGTVGYRGLGADGKAVAVYHATGTRAGMTFTVPLGNGYIVRSQWMRLESILGFPVSDAYPTRTGSQNDFEGGRLVWIGAENATHIYSDAVDGGRLVDTVKFK